MDEGERVAVVALRRNQTVTGSRLAPNSVLAACWRKLGSLVKKPAYHRGAGHADDSLD